MKLFLFISFFSFTAFHCLSDQPPGCQNILNCALRQLPNWGILRNSEGFVYVELEDEFIHKLVEFIRQDGFEEPPYFGKSNLVGAHATVIYPDEMVQYDIDEIQETGQIIFFEAKDCRIVKPPRWKEIEEVYFIVVDSPELDKMREQYGLPKREYEFHITIGVKPKDSQVVQ